MDRWTLWTRDAPRLDRSRGLLRGAEHLPHGLHEPAPGRRLGAKLTPALDGQTVELRASIVRRELPLGLDPAALLQAMERWVKRTFADLEDLARQLLDPPRDGVAVGRSPAQRLEDEQVERALQQIDRRLR